MNQGRASMEQVIHHYETQRAQALKLKQEAEIVLPYMRAAMEELDAQLGANDISAARERVQAATHEPPHHAEATASMDHEEHGFDHDMENDDVPVQSFEPKRAEDKAPRTSTPGFGRASIASLIDQKNKKADAAG